MIDLNTLSPSEAEEIGIDIDGDDEPDRCCPDATTAATKLCGCWS